MSGVIHRSKLFGGVETAEEVHRRVVWGDRRCTECRGRPVVIEIKSMILVADLHPAIRSELQIRLAIGDKRMPQPFDTPDGPSLIAGRVFACANCAGAAERAAAQGPSTARVFIDRGPGPDKTVVGVV